MDKYKKYIWLFFLFGLLVLLRAFESELFYDPYLQFFQSDYLYLDSPRREVLKVTLFTTLRFLINTIISLVILYVFFKDASMIKFSVIVYAISYIILLGLFLYFVLNPKQEDYFMFFNIRRFLIQPLILLLLLPAFYYQRKGV
ncbi:exosortase F system-associated protein [Lacinutrix sp. Bg11-31]|uniref:exosortase F system-associated membrane protein n=1 Tax=Lacinutrix sp. Bg11-31 TaxID=2057808 RepID=UPI000C31ABCF|nr:exosortase F system-associated protein [Lacinutrix sp. Bg11-31]AUC83467.1 exosortase F system-associated protein [Lacinutrix sp. Bg11-31]